MKKLALLLLLLIEIQLLTAQQTQWASEIVYVTSERNNSGAYSAQQLLGPSNVVAGDTATYERAWSPAYPQAMRPDSIQLRFAEPMTVERVIVFEAQHPGAIKRIEVIDTDDVAHLIYLNYPNQMETNYGILKAIINQPIPKVKEVRLSVATFFVEGYNLIDAVGIVSPAPSDTTLRENREILLADVTYGEAEELEMLNSPYFDSKAFESADGKTLFFNRKGHPTHQTILSSDDNVWQSERLPTGEWSVPVHLPAPINDRASHLAFAVSPSGRRLYLANSYEKVAFGKSPKTGIAMSCRNEDGSWSFPVDVPIDGAYNRSIYIDYHITHDEQCLLSCVERNDTYGSRDIYVSFRQANGHFSEPMNLGPTINTKFEESDVMLAADNKTLYFVSLGHPGYGGADVFMSIRQDDSWTNWSEPVNLGPGINTDSHERGYSISASGEYIYYSTKKISGNQDLFRLPFPKQLQPDPVVLVHGELLDSQTKTPLSGRLVYSSLEGNGRKRFIDTCDDGAYTIVAPYGDNLAVTAEVDGYFSESILIKTKQREVEELDNGGSLLPLVEEEDTTELEVIYREQTQSISLIPIEEGLTIPLNNIFFTANESVLKEESTAELDRCLRFLLQHANLVVEVGGHTNGICGESFARQLSGDRAAKVATYFKEHGVAANRVYNKGYGKSRPIATNETLEGRRKNQRVELKILRVE